MINFNPNVGQVAAGSLPQVTKPQGETAQSGEFSNTVKAVEKFIKTYLIDL